MSVYISSMARRAGAARGSQGSSASNRGGAAGGGGEKCEAGLAAGLSEDTTTGGRTGGIAQEQRAGSRRALLGAGCGSAAASGAAASAGGGLGRGVCRGVCMSVQELSYCLCLPCCTVLLQHGADPNIRNTDGKSALDLAEPSAKAVLTGQCHLPVCLLNATHYDPGRICLYVWCYSVWLVVSDSFWMIGHCHFSFVLYILSTSFKHTLIRLKTWSTFVSPSCHHSEDVTVPSIFSPLLRGCKHIPSQFLFWCRPRSKATISGFSLR